MQYTDQNPGIRLASVFLWSWRDQARRCIPGCYSTVPYQTLSTPVIHNHHPRSTRYHTNTRQDRTHTACRSLSLRSLSLLSLPSPIYYSRFFLFSCSSSFSFLFFFPLSFLSFLPQGFLATLPRHRSPFPFLLAATAGFWCPVSRPAPNGA